MPLTVLGHVCCDYFDDATPEFCKAIDRCLKLKIYSKKSARCYSCSLENTHKCFKEWKHKINSPRTKRGEVY